MIPEEVPQALSEALRDGRLEVTRHFWDELRADAFGFADVRSAIESIGQVHEIGIDHAGHLKYEVSGRSADDRSLLIVCSHKSETGTFLLITVYEGD